MGFQFFVSGSTNSISTQPALPAKTDEKIGVALIVAAVI